MGSAQSCEIEILALHVEPFGYEAIILDRNMRRSEFMQMVNQAISLAIKKKIVHFESLWSNQKPGNLPILDIETLRSEIVKVCTTPVSNGYVRKSKEWELPHFSPEDWGVEMDDQSQDSTLEGLKDSLKKRVFWGETGEINLEKALALVKKRHVLPKPHPPESRFDSVPTLETKDGISLEKFDLSEVLPSVSEVDKRALTWCPGLSKLLAENNHIVEMFTKIHNLKEALIDDIQCFEKEERRRRKRVLGIERCRLKSTFLKFKATNGNAYTDHLREVLCASLDRRKAVKIFMKAFLEDYRSALVCFIRTQDCLFPYGVLKMRTLFRAKYKTLESKEVFEFIF